MRIRRRAVAWSAAVAMLAVSLGGIAALVRIAAGGYCRGELQVEADRIALEMANTLVEQAHASPTTTHSPTPSTFGRWDATRRQFQPDRVGVNAVEVTVQGTRVGPAGNWLSQVLAPFQIDEKTTAVAAVRPRDVVFVIDLSSTMTRDTRAALKHLIRTGVADSAYSEDRELRRLYADLGFESYPGVLEPFGAPWQVGEGGKAYETLISQDGPLAKGRTDKRYRIQVGDPVSVRRYKAYRAVIDQQVARVMPQARPNPGSSKHFEYWAEYLDDVLASDDESARIGYASYLRFMLKYGRGIRAGGQYVALSQHSDDSSWHTEHVDGVTLGFPPRTEPMHEVRLGLLAALSNVAARNRGLDPSGRRDRVAIVTFDALSPGGAWVEQPFTCDYGAASRRLARLQAVGNRTREATGLAAIRLAEKLLLRQKSRGRDASQQVIFVTSSSIEEDAGLDGQIAEMTGLGQSVRVISVGLGSKDVVAAFPAHESVSPNLRNRGRRNAAESSWRDVVSSASVVLVQ